MMDDNVAASQGLLPGQRVETDAIGAASLVTGEPAAETVADAAELESWMLPRSLANPTRLRLGVSR